MVRQVSLFLGSLLLAGPALAATDFGVRTVGRPAAEPIAVTASVPVGPSGGGIREATRVMARFGRITSTFRSTSHNRAVGGAPNSYHLRGMAMDVARRPGVAHWQLASALREAGYHLIEALDEGDHSHFAIGTARAYRPAVARPSGPLERTDWGLVQLSRAVPREPAS